MLLDNQPFDHVIRNHGVSARAFHLAGAAGAFRPEGRPLAAQGEARGVSSKSGSARSLLQACAIFGRRPVLSFPALAIDRAPCGWGSGGLRGIAP